VASRIEDYALIGDCQTAALVSRTGSIDWLCLPRFDSGACFAALLGDPEHGRWLVAPRGEVRRVTRAYRPGTLVLDTTFETDEGVVTLTDVMPIRERVPHLARIVRGVRGRVPMHTELIVRFEYGSFVPWVRKSQGGGIHVVAGPNALVVQSDIPLRGERMTTVAEFDVSAGDEMAFAMTWHPSYQPPRTVDARSVERKAERAWREWSSRCTYEGEWRDLVERSLVTLKALTHTETGGIVAAPTTSLPERIAGPRNWDYRYCWVRDATITLLALAENGYRREASEWREWLLRSAMGDPSKLQIMYTVDGGRRIDEYEIPWLPGYEDSRPVRIGNAAFGQRQLDVYGELMEAMHQCHWAGIEPESAAWALQLKLVEFLETCWAQPDEGIWEVRGGSRQFTHSKVMAWVAFDRAVKSVENLGMDGPVERWRAVRDRIHAEVCARGFDPDVGSFVQHYDSKRLDASLLMIPIVGFLPASDRRVVGTVRAIEDRLIDNGLVRRYEPDGVIDGLAPGEGAFLPCSFWLAMNWALLGRHADARRMFERLLGLCNDVGLLSEECEPSSGRLLGNFPQAFSHVSLVDTARLVSRTRVTPSARRARS
jgi:GH15 family glucan-1,4-alpha-glucosidase